MSAEEARRSGSSLLVASGAFVLAYFAAAAVLKAVDLSAPARVAVTLIPLIAFLWFLLVEVRLVRGLDELERRIQLEALALAYPTAIVLFLVFGLLDRAGFIVPGFERIRDLALLALIPYPVGLVIAKKRYE
jgi:hypothetical protein